MYVCVFKAKVVGLDLLTSFLCVCTSVCVCVYVCVYVCVCVFKLKVAGDDLLWLDLPISLTPWQAYEVKWNKGSIFGNICRVLPQHLKASGGLVDALKADHLCDKVIVFVAKEDETSVLQWLRPLASLFAEAPTCLHTQNGATKNKGLPVIHDEGIATRGEQVEGRDRRVGQVEARDTQGGQADDNAEDGSHGV